MGVDFKNSRKGQFEWLKAQGFEVVDIWGGDCRRPAGGGGRFCRGGGDNDIPSDGLVLTYDDIAYGESLGRTAKFPRNSIAFKWAG
ncbi:MAG: hypothetical protein V8S98_07755 [Lachnospiraceae bacterium]